jgi:hypothetical protein
MAGRAHRTPPPGDLTAAKVAVIGRSTPPEHG